MEKREVQARIAALAMSVNVSQVMRAVAVAIEDGPEDVVSIQAAMDSIDNPSKDHLAAAIVIITFMLADVNCDADHWRATIPVFIAQMAMADVE